uniref:Alpha-mannosidase n=1 Tax=Ectomocoris sp. TaxID=3104572 RepID=A0AB38ZEA6_9HEMI
MLLYVSILVLSIIFTTNAHHCGYEQCPTTNPDVINIHLVAHTHDDVGWLKTKDQYYYGQNMSIQEAGVQYIIDSVITALQENPERRFIYVETAFFWMWWKEQTPEKRLQVQELVNNGRLEFIGGAWSMNDEAAAHYHSIIDQFTWGFRRLNESLGECATPKIGWQIDPFGHSKENANIMAKMGFDGLFLGRIDYQDKNYRIANKAMEMLWLTSANDYSDASQLFTCVMYNTYSPPPGFCFDVHCQDSPIIDNPKSPEYNVPERITTFLKYMTSYSEAYRTNNVIVTMGNDFNFQYAGMNFKNMDKLIKYINNYELNGSKFHAFYSTPSCYLKAVHDSGVALPTKSDDFFPYSSDPESFWTGYFTSRPTQKRFERMGNNFLQIGKQLLAISNLPSTVDISEAKEAMGVLQHHDAITGTEKDQVASDYALILTNAMKILEKAASTSLTKLVSKRYAREWHSSEKLQFRPCLLLNISSCPETENSMSFVVTIYNPLSRFVDKLVRLPIAFPDLVYIVRGPKGEKLSVQMLPLPDFVNIPGRNSTATQEIAFIATKIPPLGFKSYFVETTTEKDDKFFKTTYTTFKSSPELGYENGAIISLSSEGKIESLKDMNTRKEIPFNQNFYYYQGAVGNNDILRGERSSGAYIFRPNGSEIPISYSRPLTKIIKGPVVTEIRQTFSDWVNQVVRLQDGSKAIEFQWTVGPIPLIKGNETFGKEIITRYTIPSLHNNGIFYTDSNGREMLKRQLNERPTWKVELMEPISGNYYPITTRINIKDEDPNQSLTVVTDRSEGGSSLNDGQIELMLHRRLIHDDGFGVDEALNEIAFQKPLVAVGSHFVTLEDDHKAKLLVQEKVLDSWLFISETEGMTYDDWKSNYSMEFSGLKDALPDHVQILTLEPWLDVESTKKIYLLRLENVMDSRSNPLSATVNIKDIFRTLSVLKVKEMLLGGNIPVENLKRLKWRKLGRNIRSTMFREIVQDSIISLKPMEIRTFLVEVEPESYYETIRL